MLIYSKNIKFTLHLKSAINVALMVWINVNGYMRSQGHLEANYITKGYFIDSAVGFSERGRVALFAVS